MIRHHQPSDPSAGLALLAKQVDALAADVAGLLQLRTDVATHTRTLAALSDVLRTLTGEADDTGSSAGEAASGDGGGGLLDGGSDPMTAGPFDERSDEPGPPQSWEAPDWLTVTDPALAIAWLDALAVWVRRVWTRYAQIPPCWPWHPQVVAELLVTHHQWLLATGHGAGPDLLAVWHDRWRPGVAARTGKWLTACERADTHIGAGSTRWQADPAYLDEYAHWWTTTNPHPDTPTAASTSGTPLPPAPGLTRDTTR